MSDDKTLRLVQELKKEISRLQDQIKKQHHETRKILIGGGSPGSTDLQTRIVRLEKDIQAIKSSLK